MTVKSDSARITKSGTTGHRHPEAYRRNWITNGDFAVNQRGFTSTTTTDTYGHDHWRLQAADGTVTYSTQAFTAGDLPDRAVNYARIVTTGQTASTAAAALRQYVEDVRVLAGRELAISFWARAASGTPKVAVEIYRNYGAGGSTAEGGVFTSAVTLSTAWERYSVFGSLPSLTGKTLGTGNHLTLHLWTSAGSNFNTRTGSLGIQSATIDFWGVQMEEGNAATNFEQLPYADTLHNSQRYYQTHYVYVPASPAVATVLFPAEMRSAVTPTGGGTGFSSTNAASSSSYNQTTGGYQQLVWNAEY